MVRRFSVNFAILSILADAALTLAALVAAVHLRPLLRELPLLVPVRDYQLPLSFYVIVPLLWVAVLLLASVYDPRRIYKAVDEFQVVTIAVGFASLVFAGLLYLFFREVSRWLFVFFVLIDLTLLLGWRATLRLVVRLRRWPPREQRVLIVGAGEVGRRMQRMLDEYDWTGLRFVGFLDDDPDKFDSDPLILGSLEDVREIAQQYAVDDVVVALPQRAHGQINRLVVDLQVLPVRIRVIPDYFSLALYRASVDDFSGVPMINLRDPVLNEVQRLFKRLFDLSVGGFALILSLPLIGLVALAIRMDSSGPVLFRQLRVGENGRLFTMYKFRSMIDDAELLQDQMNEVSPEGKILFKKVDDPRITRVGKLIRRTSIDELPQLFNVMKGDMSIVGPRPELPWLVDRYEPWQRKRFAVPQGITGWWQVNGRADKPLHLNTEDDLYYVQNYSLWLDFYILLKTVFVVLRGKGAY